MRAAQLALDDAVDVREEGGCIAIQPLRSQEYNLAQLLSQTTPDNLHVTVDFGAPVGKEVL